MSETSAGSRPEVKRLYGATIIAVAIGGAGFAFYMALQTAEPVGAANETPAAAPIATHWTYTSHLDSLTASTIVDACATSSNELSIPGTANLSSSSGGGKLCIEHSPDVGSDVWVELEGAPTIICSSVGPCTIKVQYGNAPLATVKAQRAYLDSWVVHLLDTKQAIAALKANSRVRFSLPLYRGGIQVLDFQTDGLRWPPAPGKVVQEP